jgi:tetratricopeptide (TPR) repeat protein
MSRPSVSSPIELEVVRIREWSKSGRHHEALVAAETLAATAPYHREVLYLIAANQRCLNKVGEALATLQHLEQRHPRFGLLHQERGYCYVMQRDVRRGIDAFVQAVTINPALSASWMMLDRLYRSTGDIKNAFAAAEHVTNLKQLPSEVVRAGSLFSDGDLPAAANVLRAYMGDGGAHVEAMRLLARVEHQRGLFDEAEAQLEAALTVAPNYRAARLDYARVLIDRQKYLKARDAIDTLLSVDSDNGDCLALYAAACAGLGEHERAIAVYRQLIRESPWAPELHISLGHVFRAVGRRDEASESYRRAAAARPGFGDAYWSLANLKTYRFSDEEISGMRVEEAAPAAHPVDRYHLCFALGKALEDRHEYVESWQFYERGNALKRAESRYHSEVIEANTRKQLEVCTPQFFAARAQVGVPDSDPILIVGLPRSGSTLIEQILTSHSQVESTHELADIQHIVLGMQAHEGDPDHQDYPGRLLTCTPEDFRKLGERYLTGASAYRTGKPFFIDKMPNNFRHIGLIHLMTPNATIIDVRREPMACCFSNLKQLFAAGQEFTYSIEDIAHYYRMYLALMRHWDAMLPGRVLRVSYEDVVKDLEPQVRRLLEFCGLGFEPACLEFHKTERSVRTASSEQVRQPLFRESLSQWRNYEPWLGSLKTALGDALVRYRE